MHLKYYYCSTTFMLHSGSVPVRNSIDIQNSKRATVQSDSFFIGVVSIKSCFHAETYRIVKVTSS